MTTALETLEFRTRPQWRAWLRAHHAASAGIWLVFYKKHTGVVSLVYEDAVLEALCFGWIDSLIRRVDDDRFALKITPRKPDSNWSDSNRKRWAELKAAGLLAKPGETAAPTDNRYAPKPKVPVLPAYIAAAFRRHQKAWTFFRQLPPTERRHFVVWIHTAKRADTRARRIKESIALLAAGRPLGLR
jgi:uncharacterized protein YdeI (YjbR/CyaY-like superfamily)